MAEVRKYVNPPAAEVICEFRFPEGTPWDLTYPGMLYSRLKDDYPKRDQRYVREVVMLLGPEGLREEIVVSERSIFLAEDEGCAVQVGPRLLSVSCQKPYVHWEAFSERIHGVFDQVRDVIGIEAIGTMNLRYVNLIEIPRGEVTLSDYFAFYPALPPELPRVPAGFITGCEFAFHDNRDNCRVELTDAVPESTENNAFLLNIDYYLTEGESIPPEGVADWLEIAHTHVRDIFEACIKDTLRDLFTIREKVATAAR
ncbi:TIGR04255 family protein [Methanoculleus sp.]|uniref:TIGR04255 family protein n=1 Tax=Methanoculleus sp. TaxID=90427 RepID=UPI0025D6C35F|nr:TIGR04255 family protein [Methanoculleus sp.]